MTEPTATDPTGAPHSPTPPAGRGQTLYRALAWVGIVAGVVFIVGVVFVAGAVFGGGHPGWHRGGPDGPGPGRTMGGCPMMKSGAMDGGMQRGGQSREMPGRGMMAPDRVPPTTQPG